jgi:hypothetical protein
MKKPPMKSLKLDRNNDQTLINIINEKKEGKIPNSLVRG